MKVCLFLFLSFTGDYAFSQGVLSTSHNILFRGYDNTIEIAGNYKKPFIVTSSDGLSLTLKGSSPLTYSARVSGSAKTANIYVVSENLRDTLANYTFRIKNLPSPGLYWGSTEETQLTEIDSVLSCRYGDEHLGPNNTNFTVLTYALTFNGVEKRLQGSGGIIKNEHLELLKRELAKPRETEYLEVTVETTVKGPDGVVRKKSVIFQLQ